MQPFTGIHSSSFRRRVVKTAECLRAVQECFPELPIKEVSPLGEGWGNWTFESPDGLVFRFPKSAESAAELEAIKPVITELEDHLELPIPLYNYQSDWGGLPFVAYQKIPGTPLGRVELESSSNPQGIHQQLGKFLTQLHQFPLARLREEFPHAPKQPWLGECVELNSQVKEFVLPDLPYTLSDRIAEIFEEFLASLEANPIDAVFVHGDLEPSHILWDSSQQHLCGIIDFDDGGIGDPAWDMRLLLHYYELEHLRLILEAYEATTVDSWFMKRVGFYSKIGYFQDAISAKRRNNEEWFDRCLYAISDAFR